MRVFRDQYLVVNGAFFDSRNDAVYPRGCILVFDMDDLAAGLKWSIKAKSESDVYRYTIMDVGISETKNTLVFIATPSYKFKDENGDWQIVFGRTGDAHHPVVFKVAISSGEPMTRTVSDSLTWNESKYDICDTLTV